jgi:hypothetical protein
MSFSLSVRKVVPFSALFAVAMFAFGGGCAAPAAEEPTEDPATVEGTGADGDTGEVSSEFFWNDATSASINGWTITTKVSRASGGKLKASSTLNDNGTGGGRSAAACLVVDLNLGQCDTNADCDASATQKGLPVSVNGPNGWQHFCRPAGDGILSHHNRCWTRPGPAYTVDTAGVTQWKYCRTNALRTTSGTTLEIEHTPNSDDVALPLGIRLWSALGCLAGGLNNISLPPGPGNTVGNPAACATQDFNTGAFVVDAPIVVIGKF